MACACALMCAAFSGKGSARYTNRPCSWHVRQPCSTRGSTARGGVHPRTCPDIRRRASDAPALARRRRRRLLGSVPLLDLGGIERDAVRSLVGAQANSGLAKYTGACGYAFVQKSSNYTLSVVHSLDQPECSATYGVVGSRNDSASFPLPAALPGRCLRCPMLQAGTSYVLLLFADGGRSTGIVQVPFRTT